MKINTIIYNFLKNSLKTKSKIDGRILLVAVLIGYVSLLFFLSRFIGLDNAWDKLGVSSMNPRFADLRVVLAGFECTRLGYDAQLINPCDPWDRPFAYPRLWLILVPLGLDQSHALWGGFILAALFYIATFVMIGKLNYYGAFIYALILCSPSIMWMVERGNVDIIIYLLFFVSWLLISGSQRLVYRGFGYSLILLASFLKLFPIFALSILVQEKRKNFLSLILLFSMPFIVYWLSNLEELRAISGGLDLSFTWRSFGFKVLFISIKKFLFGNNLFGSKRLIVTLIAGIFIGLLFVFVFYKLILVTFNQLQAWLKRDYLPESQSTEQSFSYSLNGFRIGSSLYIGAFLMGTVFDYKLSFLIFAVPQMLNWIRNNKNLGFLSSIALIGIIGTLYISPSSLLNIDEIINWLLLIYFIYCFAITLPNWCKSLIHDFGSKLL